MAELVDPNKFITLPDIMRAASSAVAPARQNSSGNGIVPNANVGGTYTPGGLDISGPGIMLPFGNVLGGVSAEERAPRRPETLPSYSTPAPAQTFAPAIPLNDRLRKEPRELPMAATAPAAAPQPISVVRGLQNTNYLPVTDAQNRVSYQSEDFIKQKAAEKTAAKLGTAKSTAEIDKLLGEAQKARTPAADQRMVNTYLDTLEKYLAPQLQSPNADVRAKAVQDYLSSMEGLISKFGIESTIRRQMMQNPEG